MREITLNFCYFDNLLVAQNWQTGAYN